MQNVIQIYNFVRKFNVLDKFSLLDFAHRETHYLQYNHLFDPKWCYAPHLSSLYWFNHKYSVHGFQ